MRSREIDFLRGIAVILVLFRHYDTIARLQGAAWMGVDLFFVLSGFLVSGLIFREYLRFGNVHGKLFLIRRGFKIYPLFYFTIILAIVCETFRIGHFPSYKKVLIETLFLQSYYKGILGVTWSLAVEEHFYVFLICAILVLISFSLLRRVPAMLLFFGVIFVGCLSLRVANNLGHPYTEQSHLFPTHLRIDSLLFGVMISYFFCFYRALFDLFFARYRIVLYSLAFIFLPGPFIFDAGSFFMNTIGLTLLYVGFGIVLCLFVTDAEINRKLDRVFTKTGVDAVARAGLYSYGIYLWHGMVSRYLLYAIERPLGQANPTVVGFSIYVLSSLFLGITLSIFIEQRFLKIRDIYFPKRAA